MTVLPLCVCVCVERPARTQLTHTRTYLRNVRAEVHAFTHAGEEMSAERSRGEEDEEEGGFFFLTLPGVQTDRRATDRRDRQVDRQVDEEPLLSPAL